MIKLETDRLFLRPWEEKDRQAFAEMNADPEVMRYFPSVLNTSESDKLYDKAIALTHDDGFCFSPVEAKATGQFLGFVGLSVPRFDKPLPFLPCVEVGWRLIREAWGKGYATEAASAWLRFGFETLSLDEIVSFTTVTNIPSQRVMERLGMTRDRADDFLHPALTDGHPLHQHVLYRLDRDKWAGQQELAQSIL
ncbi:GNAT family N-acetyltransferase [Roseibium sp.]|uniref:GNAT family N-acetyltransferase n=1 Tax=Roseibium sp. TaxID=1936156 RepID=UPI003A978CAD